LLKISAEIKHRAKQAVFRRQEQRIE
jgi:hypothetical protein